MQSQSSKEIHRLFDFLSYTVGRRLLVYYALKFCYYALKFCNDENSYLSY